MKNNRIFCHDRYKMGRLADLWIWIFDRGSCEVEAFGTMLIKPSSANVQDARARYLN